MLKYCRILLYKADTDQGAIGNYLCYLNDNKK